MTYTTYPIGDFLIRIKNAALAGRKEVVVDSTTKITAVAKALERLGFLEDVRKKEGRLATNLAFKNKKPVLLGLTLVSKPGLRIYLKARELAKIRKPSTFLISTPKGVVSLKEAIKAQVGGEMIVEVW